MMIATLLERDLAGLKRAIKDFEATADGFEIRFDALKAPLQPLQVRNLTTKKLIATCRRPREGGAYNGSEVARRSLLEKAFKAGFDFVDLEADVELPLPDRHVIRSIHDFVKTPPAREVVTRCERIVRNGGYFKFAGKPHGFRDDLELLKAGRALHRRRTRASVMGLGDFPRALAHLVGSQFVYGGARTSAPGQPKLEAICETLDRWGNPGPQDQLYLVVGSPIAHSLSPRLHNAALQTLGIPAAYGALEVRTVEELQLLLVDAPELGLQGLSLTRPLKEVALRACLRHTPEAERAKAVNCIRIEGRTAHGHNTDGIAAERIVKRLTPAGQGSRTLLVGTGGAARGILARLRSPDLALAGRDAQDLATLGREYHVATYNLETARQRLTEFDLVINATAAADPLPLEGFRGALLDLRYEKTPTAWERHARTQKLRFAGGRDYLYHQGVAAFEFWTGQTAPATAMAGALGVTP